MLSESQKERYLRQIAVIGEEKQEELLHKKVLQVGSGGLGSPLALYLTAMGVGELTIFEHDTVSLSNLGRQIMYRTEDIGKSKAELTYQRLHSLNPDVKINIVQEWLTMENADKYIQGVDYLVDASDNFETKFLINDLGLKYNIPFTIAGIQGFEGQLISVDPHKTACYRCIFHEIPKTDKSKPIPVISPICGVMGSLQANEIVKGLLNIGQRTVNKVMLVSLFYGDFVRTPIKLNPRCLCQKN